MFSETRSFRETVTLTSGDKLYSSTQPTNAAGVAILCHKRHVDAVISVQVVSERLMYLDLKVLTGLVRFVAVYMPHMGYPHHELQIVYDQLHLILDGAARVGAQVVVGVISILNSMLVTAAKFWNIFVQILAYTSPMMMMI